MKKLTALTLAVVMMLAFGTASFAQSEPSSWAVSEIDTHAADFLKSATGDIDYVKSITREEFAIVALYIYAAASGMELPEMSVENPFTDCNNPLVVTAYGLGLVKGVSETEFNPEASVTREQICVMLTRISQQLVPDLNMDIVKAYLPALDNFADGDLVSDWAEDSVKLMVFAGLIKGTDEGKINPLGNCTVQEALIIAKRALNVEF
ncbi:MAG: S-layer homology domain-containing protein [Clostridia bacterium]|nr:S-layer homology domain-containing protein [Clostridia bacterium]